MNNIFTILALNDKRRKVVLILMVLCTASVCLQAQYYSKSRIKLKDGRYHKSQGTTTHSLGAAFFFAGYGMDLCEQYEYVGYKLVKPKIGLGGGVAFTNIGGYETDYEFYKSLNYINLFGYSKFYLNNKRHRFFIDSKLGYGISRFRLHYILWINDEPARGYLRSNSGIMFQQGIGYEPATRGKLKWGLNLNLDFQFSKLYVGEDGVGADSEKLYHHSDGSEIMLFIGFHIYI